MGAKRPGIVVLEMRRLAIAVALVLALAALGVGVAIAASGGGGKAPAPRTATTAAGHLVSRGWALGAIRSHGRVIVIRYTEGDCWGAAHARASESSKSVTIELLQTYTGGRGVACPEFLIVRTLSVHLKTALGRRRLVHGPVSATPGGGARGAISPALGG
jgi:hypothetical protein